MKKNHFLFFSMMIVVGVLTAWSCKKDDEKTVTKEDAKVIAKNDVVSDAVYTDIYSQSEEILSELESNKYPASGSKKVASLSGTVTITVTKNNGDTTNFPKDIVVIYDNYTSNSGIKLNGTLKITQSARIRKAQAVRKIVLENFTVNDTISVEGTKTVTYLGLVSGKPSTKIELTNGKLTFDSGDSFTRSYTHTITWESGFTTLFNIWDDVYSVSGTGNGSSSNGLSYSTTISENLEYKFFDFCIKKGKIEISVEGQKKVYLDFNRTNCADKIKLIIEGDTEEFYGL